MSRSSLGVPATKSDQTGFRGRGIPAGCQAVSPDMLDLVDLSQQEIDIIVRRVPGRANNVQDIYPLTPLQEGMLFQSLSDRKEDSYLVSTLLEFASRVSLDAFIAALQDVIDRHDI